MKPGPAHFEYHLSLKLINYCHIIICFKTSQTIGTLIYIYSPIYIDKGKVWCHNIYYRSQRFTSKNPQDSCTSIFLCMKFMLQKSVCGFSNFILQQLSWIGVQFCIIYWPKTPNLHMHFLYNN